MNVSKLANTLVIGMLSLACQDALAMGPKRLNSGEVNGIEQLASRLAERMENVVARRDTLESRRDLARGALEGIRTIVPHRCDVENLGSPEEARARMDWSIACMRARAEDPTFPQVGRTFARAAADRIEEMKRENARYYPVLSRVVTKSKFEDEAMRQAVGLDDTLTLERVGSERIAAQVGMSCADFNKQYRDYFVTGYCMAGCFAPETLILVDRDDWVTIGDAGIDSEKQVLTLSKDADLDSLVFKFTPVASYIASDLAQEDKKAHNQRENALIEITTETGIKLRVTTDHAILLGAGVMVRASEVAPNDLMLQANGRVVAVQSVTSTTYPGRVYNLNLQTAEPRENIIVANGLLVGTNYFQANDAGLKALSTRSTAGKWVGLPLYNRVLTRGLEIPVVINRGEKK